MLQRTILSCVLFLTALTAAGLAMAQDITQDPTTHGTIFVIDGSNSMWGQIDGTAKIELARNAFEQAVASMDADAAVGLMAYGHRNEGDCTDIEVLRQPGPLDRVALVGAVAGLQPTGKTPIAAAVKQAAQLLLAGGQIVLLSDGADTCSDDPCAEVGASLGKASLHVIGFDVGDTEAEELSCMAKAGNGRFLRSANADELNVALAEAAATPAGRMAQVEGQVTLTHNQQPNAASVNDTVFDSDSIATAASSFAKIALSDGSTFSLDADSVATLSGYVLDPEADSLISLARGTLRARVGKTFSARRNAFRVKTDQAVIGVQGTFFSAAAGPDATTVECYEGVVSVASVDEQLTTVRTLNAGQRLTVTEGQPVPEPESFGLKVQVAGASNAQIKVLQNEEAVAEAIGTELDAALPPGNYQVTATVGERNQSKEVSIELGKTTAPVVFNFTQATLQAPDNVGGGARFPIQWTGPAGEKALITIVSAGAAEDERGNYVRLKGVESEGTAELQAPDAPGDYELRYRDPAGATIATRAIVVTPVEATLTAPEQAPGGAHIEITWTGPDNQNDYITVTAPDAGDAEYGNYTRTRNGSPVKLQLPDAAGTYELRYVTDQSKTVLARQAIEVTELEASLEAPEQAPAGSHVEVTWQGPDNQNDYVTVVAPDAADDKYGDYTRTRNGSPLKIQLPDDPGTWELRYVTDQSKTVLARHTIEATAVTASLTIPETVGAGGAIEVQWEGPDNQNDYINIVEPGTPDNQGSLDYFRTRNGSPGTLRAPEQPGDYEVRYISDQSKSKLASAPITVTPVEAELSVRQPVMVGGKMEITWTGPDNSNDYITVVPAGSPEGTSGDYARTRNGSPITLDTPETPGDYEVRYVMNESKRVLASTPVTVMPLGASLEAPAKVTASQRFEVTWTGPDGQGDAITIAQPDADPATYSARALTRAGNPAKLFAPSSAGDYELRYVTKGGEVLAKREIAVE